MPNVNAPSVRDQLNRCLPAAAKAKLGDLLSDLIDAQRNQVIASAALAIKTGGSAIVANSRAFCYMIGGVLYQKAASDMSALAGTLATAKAAAWAFYIDSAGTITTAAKTADAADATAALALVAAPPSGKVILGIVVVANATGSNFVGGTTALDTGSLTVSYLAVHGGRVTANATPGVEDRT